ncbi:MAG: A/G-specific adenine glycosylase [Oscillospiraceae bacterium]|nr:A/G-specific adenine glycosylase [Oscillospiraceae bacterium]
MKENLAAIVRPLLDWYNVNKRTLPWRGIRDPYKVLVSEIMLQQTRVAAVIPYYFRWMEELPDVEALANADEERLMKLWQGLGYYNRARNLQKAARMVMEEYGGRFPEEYGELLRLPGVGDYTAGAVASIAFGRRVPAVDGNVLRVAARVTGTDGDILDPRVRRWFRDQMEAVTPEDRPGEFNQALMDLGATICLPNGAPDCGRCPLSGLCEANRQSLQDKLPVRRKKAARRTEELTVYLLVRQGRVALRRRENAGLLAGLWEFPHVPGALTDEEAAKPLAGWGLTAREWRKKLSAKHIFTHVEWRMTGYLLEAAGTGSGFTWADRAELEALAVPSAFGKFLEEARRALEEETR